jgi:hypothetical protein
MPLTMREFGDGIAYWRDSTRWPADFHNAFYGRLADQNPHGEFAVEWWETFSRHLSAWKAIRPASTAELTGNAMTAFPALRGVWSECCAPVAGLDTHEVG